MSHQLHQNDSGAILSAAHREQIVEEIDGLFAALQAGMDRLKRIYYYKIGERLILLRATWDQDEAYKNKTKRQRDDTFVAFCRKKFPGISDPQRKDYIAYRIELGGPVTSASLATDVPSELPPLRRATNPKGAKARIKTGQYERWYKKIVDEEIGGNGTRFEVRDSEDGLVRELAVKIISTGYRVLSVKLHPDKGGSDEAQRRLNAARKLLQDLIAARADEAAELHAFFREG